MPSIKVKEKENFEIALRRFKRFCEKSGIFIDVKKKGFYEKPTWIRRRKKKDAVKKTKIQASRNRIRKRSNY